MNNMTSLEGLEVAPRFKFKPKAGEGSVVKSAERVLTILEFFDNVKRSACVSEVSRALDYPQSSTSVLLRSLVTMGYLAQDGSCRSYYPTRRVSLLGNWLDPEIVQNGRLLGFAETLAEKSGLTVVLAAQNGTEALYIHVVRSSELASDVPSVSIGERCSILKTSVGRAILSTYSDNHIASLVMRLNAERPEGHAPVVPGELIESIAQQRNQAFFLGESGIPGHTGLSVVLDRGDQMMVLGIEGEPDLIRNSEKNLASRLHQSVGEIH